MADGVDNAGRCEALPYTINITDAVYQSMKGNYFLGQTRLLLFGDGMNAWGALFNPPGSQVSLNINTFAVSSYTVHPFAAQIWFNTSIECQFAVSNKVTAANTMLQPVPRPKVKLQFAEAVPVHPAGGVNPFNRIIEPQATTVVNKGGEFIIPPGGSFLVFLVSPRECLVQARIAFGWWESKIC